jgi:DNA-nicking Smr family endonuclease
MDFGKILDQWENKEKQKEKHHPLEKHLDNYLPDQKTVKEKESSVQRRNPGLKRSLRLKKKPQKTIDLHRMTLKEAIEALDRFFRECKKEGIEKVLIIHGKGKHSNKPFVLAKKIKEYIQNHPLAGEYGPADKEMGGSGAIWVMIRYVIR